MKSPLQVPVTFGHWLIKGSRLVCRLPRKTVTVNAPKKLLMAVMQACDGSRSWAEMLGMLKANWDAKTLTPFMHALVHDGVLVESSLLWAHWADVAQLPAITSTAATAQAISKLHLVAESRLLPGCGNLANSIQSGRNSFAKILGKRESARTFDDKPISVECLCSILWAAQGVTRADENSAVPWHRTIASGGNMHSARWFVVVLRELVSEDEKTQQVSSGIYEARFHKLGGASLQKIRGDEINVWRCIKDPRVLRFASAVVLPVYDVSVPAQKYGNRATLYAVLESGQALQNAQLMAFELGASCMLRGDTIAHESLRMLGLKNDVSHWLSVPTIVVGAQATHKQLKQQQLENALTIMPNVCLPGNSFAFASKPARSESSPLFSGSGRSCDPKLALTKAEAEGWERMAWASLVRIESDRFKIGQWSDIQCAVDPNSLVAYSRRQYSKKGFPFTPFSSRRQYLWANGVDAESGKGCSVLAECVYASSALPSFFQKHLFTNASTSGMAAGTSQQDALCRATLELIERDAFVCAWISRRAPPAIKCASLPKAAQLRIKALEQAGFQVAVSDISSAWVPVISVFTQNAQLPFTAITAAACFTAEEALAKALDEAEGRIAQAQSAISIAAEDENPIRQVERLYRTRAGYGKSNFYYQADGDVSWSHIDRNSCQNWSTLQSVMFGQGFNLLTVDMTPPNATIGQGRVPLHVLRAFLPGLVPIWFGRDCQPEALSRFSSCASAAKRQFGGQFFIHPFT